MDLPTNREYHLIIVSTHNLNFFLGTTGTQIRQKFPPSSRATHSTLQDSGNSHDNEIHTTMPWTHITLLIIAHTSNR